MTESDIHAPRSHAVCLSRNEVILSGVLFVVGVGLSTLHEVLFGSGGMARVLSTVVDATQGSLFWSAILIGLGRLAQLAYGAVRKASARNVA